MVLNKLEPLNNCNIILHTHTGKEEKEKRDVEAHTFEWRCHREENYYSRYLKALSMIPLFPNNKKIAFMKGITFTNE